MAYLPRRSLSIRSQPQPSDRREALRELPVFAAQHPSIEEGIETEQDVRIDTSFLEKITNDLQRFSTCHRRCSPKRSIYKVPPVIRELGPEAYTPQVVSIGPCHYNKNPSYKDMQECKWRVVDRFISQHTLLDEGQRTSILINRCLVEMKKHDATIRSYYSYETSMDRDELALLMMLDGCFILYLLLETRQSPVEYYSVGGVRIRSQLVKYDLLLVENQIPFFVINELHHIVGTGDDIGVNLVEKALALFQDIDLPRNKSIPVTGDVLHLLDLFYNSLLPTSYSRKSETPVWAIPCATELMEHGIVFDKNKKAESFLDINFRKKGIARKAVMEIPPLKLYDSTTNLFCNLLAFEQCHPSTGFNITVYIAFMDCIINNEKDARLLHLKGILINCMTGYQDLTCLFRCLCAGAHTAEDRFYLANVFADVTKHQEAKWNKSWAKFKREYCSNEWAVFAAVVSVIFFVLAVVQTFFGIFRYYHPKN